MAAGQQWRGQRKQEKEDENGETGGGEAVASQRPQACFEEAETRQHKR